MKSTRGRNRRAASLTEYLVILAAISLAILGSVTLLGRAAARLWKQAGSSLDQGAASNALEPFPTQPVDDIERDVEAGKPPPNPARGEFPTAAAPGEYLPAWKSLLGDGGGDLTDFLDARPPSDQLPDELWVPTCIGDAGQAAMKQTRRPGSLTQEHGGTLVRDAGGNLRLVNPGPGARASFNPNFKVDEGDVAVGFLHTHPVDRLFAIEDIASMLCRGDSATVLHTPSQQAVLVATAETPDFAKSSWQEVYDEIARVWDDATMPLRKEGMNTPHALLRQAGLAAIMQHCKLALYRGAPGGALRRDDNPLDLAE